MLRLLPLTFALLLSLSAREAVCAVAPAAEWETVTISEVRFPEALRRLQDWSYQKEDWDAFFGRAVYYRANLGRAENKTWIPELVALEALALSRHCHWAEARRVLAWAKTKGNNDLFTRVEAQVALHESFAKTKKAGALAFASPEGTRPWWIGTNQLEKVSNPRFVRVHVRSLCE